MRWGGSPYSQPMETSPPISRVNTWLSEWGVVAVADPVAGAMQRRLPVRLVVGEFLRL